MLRSVSYQSRIIIKNPTSLIVNMNNYDVIADDNIVAYDVRHDQNCFGVDQTRIGNIL
jgi:hypothetical protein